MSLGSVGGGKLILEWILGQPLEARSEEPCCKAGDENLPKVLGNPIQRRSYIIKP